MGTRRAKTSFIKNNAGGITLPDCKIYKAKAIMSVWYWHKDKSTDLWNRKELPKIDPHISSQLSFNKFKGNFSGEKIIFFIIDAGTVQELCAEKKEL